MRRATDFPAALSVCSAILWLILVAGARAEERVSFYEATKLLASDGAPFDNFGDVVAISGDTVVVGAPSDDDLGDLSGAAYFFERDAGGPNGWGQVAKRTASDGTTRDEFGECAAIDDDTVVVGAPNDLGNRPGSVYIFERHAGGSGNWGEVAKLTASDGYVNDDFGVSVAIDGDTVVVGSRDDSFGTNSGAIYIFERHAGGSGNWGEVAKLTASDGQERDEFGNSVAISGDTVVVGAHRADGELGCEYGAGYVFERHAGAPGGWRQVAQLVAFDGQIYDVFGTSVAIDGDTVVVGAPGDGDLDVNSGSVYVFERDAGGPDGWGLVAKWSAPDGGPYESFGGSVGIRHDRIVVGAKDDNDVAIIAGSAYIFERAAGDPAVWRQLAKLTASDGSERDEFGFSVGIGGDTVVVSAWADDDLGRFSGSAYVFQETTVDPYLAVSGSCPAAATFTGSGLTNKGRAVLYGGLAEGVDTISEGFCAGTALSLEGAVRLNLGKIDDTGVASGTRVVPSAACGAYFQALDLTSCAVSNVDWLPAESPAP